MPEIGIMGSKHVQQVLTAYGFKPDSVSAGADLEDLSAGVQGGSGRDRLAKWFSRGTDRLGRLRMWMKRRVSWSRGAEICGEKAMRILEDPSQITYVAPGHYSVASQSQPGLYYDVKLESSGRRVCNCPDHMFRKAQCKHILSVTAYVVNRDVVEVLGTEDEDVRKLPDVHIPEDEDAHELPDVPMPEKAETKNHPGKKKAGSGKKRPRKKQKDKAPVQLPVQEDEPVVEGLLPVPPAQPKPDNLETDPDGTVHLRPLDTGPDDAPLVCRKKGCDSTDLSKYDHSTQQNDGISCRWKCNKCGAVLVYRGGMERMRCEKTDVCEMLDFNSKGMSSEEIAQSLSRRTFRRHPSNIYMTLNRFGRLLHDYTLRIPLNHLGDRTCGYCCKYGPRSFDHV